MVFIHRLIILVIHNLRYIVLPWNYAMKRKYVLYLAKHIVFGATSNSKQFLDPYEIYKCVMILYCDMSGPIFEKIISRFCWNFLTVFRNYFKKLKKDRKLVLWAKLLLCLLWWISGWLIKKRIKILNFKN